MGRVQMVMFRDFTRRGALALGLKGTVKNNPDGSVAIVAEGPETALEKLLVRIRTGSLLSKVENVEVEWKEPTGEYADFIIAY